MMWCKARRWLAAAVVVAALPLVTGPAPAASASIGPRSFLTVMTRNMDEGTDFGYILAAAGHPELLGPAIVKTFCEVAASNVIRSDAVAAGWLDTRVICVASGPWRAGHERAGMRAGQTGCLQYP